jgi:hypothetical protein
MGEMDQEISPFTVKDALHGHDRRINELSDEIKDRTNETNAIVKGFEDKFVVLMDRINKGVSPTMQDIKDKSHDIEKQIIELKGDMNLRFSEVTKQMEVRDVEIESNFKSVDKNIDVRLQGSDDLIRGLKGLLWKIAGWAVVSGIAAFISMWLYIQQLKTNVAMIPTAINTSRK